MATAASLNIGLNAYTSSWTKGLRKGAADVRTFAKDGEASMSAWAKSINKGDESLKKFTSDRAKFRDEKNQDFGAVASILKVTAAIGVMRASFHTAVRTVETFRAAMHWLGEIGRTADLLGVTTTQLQGLQQYGLQAGLSADETTAAIKNMSLAIGEASFEGVGAGATALKTLGLDAEFLASLSPDQQVRKVVDGLAAIKDPAQQASLAVTILGDSGLKMVAKIKEGSAGLDDAAAKVVGITDEETRMAQAADVSIQTMFNGFTALGQLLLVQLAPSITYVSDLFIKWASDGDKGGTVVVFAVDLVSEALGYARDGVSLLGASFKGTQSLILSSISAVVNALSFLGKGVEWVIGKITGKDTDLTSFLDLYVEELDRKSRELWAAAGANVSEVGKGAARVRALTKMAPANSPVLVSAVAPKVNVSGRKVEDLAAKEREKWLDRLRTDGQKLEIELSKLDKIRLDPFEKLRAEGSLFGDFLGVKTIESAVVALAEYKQKLELIRKLQKSGRLSGEQARHAKENATQSYFDSKGAGEFGGLVKEINEAFRSPLEKVSEDFGHLLDAANKGMITNPASFALGAQKIYQRTFGSETKFAGAVDARSTEGRSAILNATQGTSKYDALRDLAGLFRQFLGVQRQQLGVQEQTKNAVVKGNNVEQTI